MNQKSVKGQQRKVNVFNGSKMLSYITIYKTQPTKLALKRHIEVLNFLVTFCTWFPWRAEERLISHLSMPEKQELNNDIIRFQCNGNRIS